MKNIVELAKQYDSVEEVKKEQKRVASVKCRLKKQKARSDYSTEMAKVLEQEQILKEIKDYFEPKKPTFTTLSDEQIALLNYDETLKAIKSVQSKKCNAQYLTEDVSTNVEYQSALEMEKKLLEHKQTVKPIDETVVKKSDILAMIEHFETLDKLEKDYVIEQMRGLLA